MAGLARHMIRIQHSHVGMLKGKPFIEIKWWKENLRNFSFGSQFQVGID
jgi:hypothetical protein